MKPDEARIPRGPLLPDMSESRIHPPGAMLKLRMMEKSLRCFGYGFASLLPLLGFIFGIAALAQFVGSRRPTTVPWNAAASYRWSGAGLALLGLGLNLLLVAFVMVQRMKADSMFPH